MTADEIARAQIEALTHAELETDKWEHTIHGGQTSLPFAYWYDGTPEWCASDFPGAVGGGLDPFGRNYRTAVVNEMFGEAKTPDGWERLAAFNASPETGCDCGGVPECAVCEGDGLIYIGEGWREVIYREAFEVRVEHEDCIEVQLAPPSWPDDYFTVRCEYHPADSMGVPAFVEILGALDEHDGPLDAARTRMLREEYPAARLREIIEAAAADEADLPDAADEAEKARGY